MNTLGLRVTPKVIFYSFLSDDEYEVDKLVVPVSFDTPRKLSYIRTNLSSIIKELKINYVALRVVEPTADNVNKERLNIEGVLQELMCDCNILGYETFIKKQIKTCLAIDFDELAQYFEKNSNSSPAKIPLNDWKDYNQEEKESILVALSLEEKISG